MDLPPPEPVRRVPDRPELCRGESSPHHVEADREEPGLRLAHHPALFQLLVVGFVHAASTTLRDGSSDISPVVSNGNAAAVRPTKRIAGERIPESRAIRDRPDRMPRTTRCSGRLPFSTMANGVSGENPAPASSSAMGRDPSDSHVDGEGPVLRQEAPVDGAFPLFVGLVAGDEGDGRGSLAVRQRNGRRRRAPHRGGDPRDDLERNPFPREMLRLLAAPSEHERVAGFQADDGFPLPRQPDHRLVDRVLLQDRPVPGGSSPPGEADPRGLCGASARISLGTR